MSQGLIILAAEDFSIKQTEHGPQLHHRINGISLILFYSKSCNFCQTLIPVFKELPGKVHGVHFGMANVSANEMRLQQKAEGTASKITYVPYLVVYINGAPYMEYRGPKNLESMAKFVYEVSMKINSGQDFSFGKVCTNQKSSLPGYCAGGVGEEDEDVCYMTYNEAYTGQPDKPAGGQYYTYDESYSGGGGGGGRN